MSGLVHIPLQKDAAEMDTMDIGVGKQSYSCKPVEL